MLYLHLSVCTYLCIHKLATFSYAHTYILYVYACLCTVCHEEFYEGLLWRTQIADRMSHLRCSEFHPSFQSGVYIGRMCGSEGQWKELDFSNCTMDLDARPFISIEIRQLVNNYTDSEDIIDSIANRVRMYICTCKHMYV